MKAVEYDRYGSADELQVREVAAPRPGRGDVLVRVHAAALNPKDVLIRRGKFPFLAGRKFPKRVGYDWSGEVIEVAAGTSGVRAGDRAFGMIGGWAGGAVAELVVARHDQLARMPSGSTWEEAAAIPLAGLTALQALRDVAGLGAGQHVTIHGASGGVGVFAIPIAKALGAHVTTTSSDANRELCRSLGADLALDYQRDPIVDSTRRCDAFFDVFGNQSFARVRPMLAPSGTFVSTVPKAHVIASHLSTLLRSQRARLVVVRSRARDLEMLARWYESGALRPVIDSTFSLAEIREAQVRVETRRSRGKVIVRVL